MSEIVRMEHYSFTYAGQQSPAIRNVCLSVRQGDFILLTGKSGSGKSTLLRQMKRELVPAGEISGEIRINGKDLSEISQRESAVTVGYLGQNIEQQIVAEKVWQELVFGLENLGWNQDRMEKKIRQMARLFSLEEWMEKNMSQLSGGQKQRVLLASILAMEPNVLLLDEPTAQLDDAMAKEFLREVARGNRECRTAVLLAEHRIRYALPYSSRSCRMENGRLLETTGKKADFFPLVRRGEKIRSATIWELSFAM